jgi:hypothetical protein
MSAQAHPTLLRHPILAPRRMLGEEVLPLAPEAYKVHRTEADWWVVIETETGTTVYAGPGPVEVVRSPAPC